MLRTQLGHFLEQGARCHAPPPIHGGPPGKQVLLAVAAASSLQQPSPIIVNGILSPRLERTEHFCPSVSLRQQ